MVVRGSVIRGGVMPGVVRHGVDVAGVDVALLAADMLDTASWGMGRWAASTVAQWPAEAFMEHRHFMAEVSTEAADSMAEVATLADAANGLLG
jgi:hypothetical protein